MIRFTTETGSVYELDPRQQVLRRRSGSHPVTRNQRADGAWRHYERLTLWGEPPEFSLWAPVAGERLLIVWGREPDTPEILRRTFTSMVTEVKAVGVPGKHKDKPAEEQEAVLEGLEAELDEAHEEAEEKEGR